MALESLSGYDDGEILQPAGMYLFYKSIISESYGNVNVPIRSEVGSAEINRHVNASQLHTVPVFNT